MWRQKGRGQKSEKMVGIELELWMKSSYMGIGRRKQTGLKDGGHIMKENGE